MWVINHLRCFDQKKFFDPKFFWPKIFFDQNFFCDKIFLFFFCFYRFLFDFIWDQLNYLNFFDHGTLLLYFTLLYWLYCKYATNSNIAGKLRRHTMPIGIRNQFCRMKLHTSVSPTTSELPSISTSISKMTSLEMEVDMVLTGSSLGGLEHMM